MNDETTMDVPSPTTSAGISRRRLAFRMPVLRNAPQIVDEQPTTSQNSRNVESPVTCQTPTQKVDDTGVKKKQWSHSENMAYYDGLKMYGKDFDAISKYLERRKIMKDREQIKNHFHNSLKIIKSCCGLTDDDLSDVPKDPRELYLVINAFEMKKRTNNFKMAKDKLLELIMEGSTNVRLMKKIVQIRTPVCVSSTKWFRVRKTNNVPTEIQLLLHPRSNDDATFMKVRNLNPYLKLKMNTNDRLHKVIEFLHKKWRIPTDSTTCSISLWPDQHVEVGSLCIVESDISPYISPSLNKLRKELEETKNERMKMVTPKPVVTASEVIRTKPSYQGVYNGIFQLTDKLLESGLSIRNCRNIIIAELFCVCGMQSRIQLRYEIVRTERECGVEPWVSVCGLLKRGFGESLCSINREKKVEVEEPKTVKPQALPVVIKQDPPPIVRRDPPFKKRAVSVNCGSSGSGIKPMWPKESGNLDPKKVPEMVRAENNAFESQVLSLMQTGRPKPGKSLIPAKRMASEENTTTKSQSSEEQQFVVPRNKPTCYVIPAKVARSNSSVSQIFKAKHSAPIQQPMLINNQVKAAPSPSRPTSSNEQGTSASCSVVEKKPRVDFSDLTISPIKQPKEVDRAEIYRKQFLSSLETPVKTPIKTPIKPNELQKYGLEMSMSPSSTRRSHADGTGFDEETRCSMTDQLFGEITLTPTKMEPHRKQQSEEEGSTSTPQLAFSAAEVHQTYHVMLESSQDSRDFVLQPMETNRRKQQKK